MLDRNKGNKGKDGIEGWRNAGPSFLVGRNFKILPLAHSIGKNTPPELEQGLEVTSTNRVDTIIVLTRLKNRLNRLAVTHTN